MIRIAGRTALGVALTVLAGATPGHAQGYRLRLDTRVLTASYRGVNADSIPRAQAVVGPTGGFVTPDGVAVTCIGLEPYCHFYRPGPRRTGTPITSTADAVVWGLGVPGLSVRSTARIVTDLSDQDVWPATEPTVQLLEGYAQFERTSVTVRAGRQVVTSRLGYEGFDGGWLGFRAPDLGLDVAAYGGWGLARGAALPVTSPALNPLDDFQPRDRQVFVGVEAGWTNRYGDLRADYRREVDPAVDYFVSERASVSGALRPLPRVRLQGGAEYDFSNAWWGSADAALSYTRPGFHLAAEVRQYRPFFDLWTIWGAFSPVPYHAVGGSASVRALPRLTIHGHGERYWYDESGAATPLVQSEDRGWRVSGGATYDLERWTVAGGFRTEYGPGASMRSLEAAVTYQPNTAIALSARAATLERPLEFRFDESRLDWVALAADVRLSQQWRLSTDLTYINEDRRRPDAAQFDWDQLRVSTRLVFLLGSAADRLPPAVRGQQSGGKDGERGGGR